MHTIREDAGRIILGTLTAPKLSPAEYALCAMAKKTVLSLIQRVPQNKGTASRECHREITFFINRDVLRQTGPESSVIG